jgi:hypothetical protein
MLPTGRHSYGCGRKERGIGDPTTAWLRSTVGVEVGVLCPVSLDPGGSWTVLRSCPRTYLLFRHSFPRGLSLETRYVARLSSRYYDPLGLPLAGFRFHLRLIRTTLPRRRLTRRASPVPNISLHACHAPYPVGTRRALRNSRTGPGLHRDMIGSAPELFLCRGCRLHFMLRPACLLPPHGNHSRWRLSTSRLGHGDLSPRLGPATRRSDAYREGTLTPWRCPA